MFLLSRVSFCSVVSTFSSFVGGIPSHLSHVWIALILSAGLFGTLAGEAFIKAIRSFGQDCELYP
jgi:hypothetical protein